LLAYRFIVESLRDETRRKCCSKILGTVFRIFDYKPKCRLLVERRPSSIQIPHVPRCERNNLPVCLHSRRRRRSNRPIRGIAKTNTFSYRSRQANLTIVPTAVPTRRMPSRGLPDSLRKLQAFIGDPAVESDRRQCDACVRPHAGLWKTTVPATSDGSLACLIIRNVRVPFVKQLSCFSRPLRAPIGAYLCTTALHGAEAISNKCNRRFGQRA
jgi:hypothetical protein